MDENITSVETEEVAELPEETGEEVSEVAEPNPEEGKTDADARFAQMRRDLEEAQRLNAEYEQRIAESEAFDEAREQAYDDLLGGDTLVQAIAENRGLSEDEVLEYLQSAEDKAETELAMSQKDTRIAELEKELQGERAERQMEKDIVELKKLDPNIKSLEDLGENYVAYINAGLTAKQAYYAMQAEKSHTEAKPPEEIGMVNTTKPESQFYTESEIEAMSPDELRKNHKKVIASLNRGRQE